MLLGIVWADVKHNLLELDNRYTRGIDFLSVELLGITD